MICLLYIMFKVFKFMRIRHKYEFDRIYKETFYFVNIICVFTISECIVLFSMLIYIGRKDSNDTVALYCNDDDNTYLFRNICMWFSLFINITMVFRLSFAYIIIKIKSDRDII